MTRVRQAELWRVAPVVCALAWALAGPVTAEKLSAIAARDASILADTESRTYYLYVSSGSPAGVAVYHSVDLVNWQGPIPVPVAAASWADSAQGIRDPRVYAYRGKYYLLATLFNRDTVISRPPETWRLLTAQGTGVWVGASPGGPFTAVPNSTNKPYTPQETVASGGALYVEGDLAWLVYAHDWTQVVDGAMEAVHLKADLSAPAEEPIYLFKASDAPWLAGETATSRDPRYYPIGAPCVYRTRGGSLTMIWQGSRKGKAAVAVARSVTGKLRGPWKQEATLADDDSVPGAVFRTFDGRLMLVLSRPASASEAHARLVELEDTGSTVREESNR